MGRSSLVEFPHRLGVEKAMKAVMAI
jgi:hypothetical protein